MGDSFLPQAPIPKRFAWVGEPLPGPEWLSLLESTWPSYRKWFLKQGAEARPDLATCRAQLALHMPELVPIWEHLVELTGGDELAARMLSLVNPSPYVTGCSQAVWSAGEPALVRNYDYHPGACEGIFLHSTWTGKRTVVSSDCLWGALDGMNEDGLVVSLAFGGRREVGDGFGIPLILRYVLETCSTTAAAAAVLLRIPCHMSYNVSLLDAVGERAVVALAPDRPPSVERRDFATNHQSGLRWSRYDKFTRSREREARLGELTADQGLSEEEFCRSFLDPPLFATHYARAFGTLYTVVYRPRSRTITYLWPDERVEQSVDSFLAQSLVVAY